jgi:hypothetical protein
MKRIAGIVFVIVALSAHAKCHDKYYVIKGFVTEALVLSPIVGAEVTVEWSDFSPCRTYKVVGQTDHMGGYSITVPFRPWSGNINRHDLCGANLFEVSVFVSASGFDGQAQKEPVASLSTTANYSLKRTAGVGLR